MIRLSPLKPRRRILEFRFLILNNHVTLHSRTPIFRFFRIVWSELSDEHPTKIFPRFYKFSVLSRIAAINNMTLNNMVNLQRSPSILDSFLRLYNNCSQILRRARFATQDWVGLWYIHWDNASILSIFANGKNWKSKSYMNKTVFAFYLCYI